MLALSWAAVGVKWYRTTGTKSDEAAGPRAAGSGNPADKPVAAGELLLQLKGNMIPSLQIAVSPRDVGGELIEVNFSEGKLVRQNDELAKIVDAQYRNRFLTEKANYASALAQVQKANSALAAARNRVAKTNAALAAAGARVTRAEVMQDRARKDFDQESDSQKRGVGIIQNYNKAKAELDAAFQDLTVTKEDASAATLEIRVAEQEVETAKALVTASEEDAKASESRRDEAKRLLDNCTIKAPIDGTVLSKKADRGSLVSPASFNVSASLCEIADLKKLEVEVDVPERQIARLLKRDPNDPSRAMPWDAELIADAAPDKKYRGYVDRIMPIADDGKNVVRIRIRVYLPKGKTAAEDEVPGSLLRPKMGVVATVYNRRFTPSDMDQKWGDEPDSLR
jgi:multidrug resistance efflux pump